MRLRDWNLGLAAFFYFGLIASGLTAQAASVEENIRAIKSVGPDGEKHGIAIAASNADDNVTKRLLQGIDVAALRKMIADIKAKAAQQAQSKGEKPGAVGSERSEGCVSSGAAKVCTVND